MTPRGSGAAVGEAIFAPGFKTEPYWWEAAPPVPADDRPVPERVEVAIIGSGYCGLSAALELARAGTRVAVLESGSLGQGASSRNGGMVGGTIRLDWAGLERRFGPERGGALLDGARDSFEHLEGLIERERLDADYARTGRFIGACTPLQFRRLREAVAKLGERAATVRIVPREAQRSEIGSDLYHGGVVIQESGGLHAAKLHRGLLRAACEAGVKLNAHAEVRALEREASGFRLHTARGDLRADQVLVATNGYTGRVTPALRRRVIPVSSYIIATEELPLELTSELSPRGRMLVDWNRLLSYFRLSPDRRRVLFGGRVSLREVDERTSAQALYRRMCRVWPQLDGVRITHSWKGNTAFTFDRLPHMGVRDGVHFAMGCNGSGVAMATWLGWQSAQKLLGRQNRPCPFETLDFPTRPLYVGRPWFLPAVGAWYRLLDSLDARRG
jgi:glycine/D-amino acid oxidase-like deaminating enzyme